MWFTFPWLVLASASAVYSFAFRLPASTAELMLSTLLEAPKRRVTVCPLCHFSSAVIVSRTGRWSLGDDAFWRSAYGCDYELVSRGCVQESGSPSQQWCS